MNAERRTPNAELKRSLLLRKSAIRNPQSAIRISVEDHGAGIPEAVREHIFEPFFTTKDKSVGAGNIGKGLGLFVSHAYVQEHGGLLTVESEVGQWTRFRVDLPIDSGNAEAARDEDELNGNGLWMLSQEV